MGDVFDSGEGLSVEGESVDLNQLKGLFTEWLDSDVQDGIYRCVYVEAAACDAPLVNTHLQSHTAKQKRARRWVFFFLNFQGLSLFSPFAPLLSVARLAPPQELCVPELVWQSAFLPQSCCA